MYTLFTFSVYLCCIIFTVSSSQSSTVFREKILGNFKWCIAWSYEGRKMYINFCL